MTRRALVVGSQTHGLSGVDYDIVLMEDILVAHGFETRVISGSAADRAGILDGYERLVRDSREGDAVVVYYSGHGGHARSPIDPTDAPGLGTTDQRNHRFLVPTDIDRSSAEDFRGIFDIELSYLQARLAAKTRNLSTILDCCFAARMSRALETHTPRALARPWTLGVEAGLAAVERSVPRIPLAAEGHPEVLRLVAAGPYESAYEHTNADGLRVGIFTEALYDQLALALDRPRTCWDVLLRRLRHQVLACDSRQRCQAEGPRNRVVFTLEEAPRRGVLFVDWRGETPYLDGGRLHGVDEGDQLAIGPASQAIGEAPALAKATVLRAGPAESLIRLDPAGSPETIPEGSPAVVIAQAFERRPVALDADGEVLETVRQALLGSARLRPRSASDPGKDLLARIEARGGRLKLEDSRGDDWLDPVPWSPEALARLVENLELLARTACLRSLESGTGEECLSSPFGAVLGRVVEGRPRPLEPFEKVATGESLTLSVSNDSRDVLYVSAFDLGIDGAITLLTRSEPAGIELRPGHRYHLGYRQPDGWVGCLLDWPVAVPKTVSRDQTVLVVVSDRPTDLRSHEATGLRALPTVEPRWRGTRTAPPAPMRYAVRHLDFEVLPPP